MVAHGLETADLQDCKLSGAQGQNWHQSETNDKKGDGSEVQGTKDKQAVPTANWNVKSAVWITQGRAAQKKFGMVTWVPKGLSSVGSLSLGPSYADPRAPDYTISMMV